MASSAERADVGTTKRLKLTPTQRLALFEAKGGRCCLCGGKISGAFIAEHLRALGLGGAGERDSANIDIAHPRCAAAKTKDDMARIAKAKRTKKAAHGIKAQGRPLESRNDLPGSKQAEKRTKDRLPPASGPTELERRYGIKREIE